jgi:guanylate kinase
MPKHLKLLLFGTSGSGKSTLLELLTSEDPRWRMHVKDTTRPEEARDQSRVKRDLNHITTEEFKTRKRAGHYLATEVYDSHLYGVVREQIENDVRDQAISLIILGGLAPLRELKRQFLDSIAIFLYAAPDDVKERLGGREHVPGTDPAKVAEVIARRLRINDQAYEDFLNSNALFEHVIVNYLQPRNLLRQTANIIRHWERVLDSRGAE